MKSGTSHRVFGALVVLGLALGFAIHAVKHPATEGTSASAASISPLRPRSSSRPPVVIDLARALEKSQQKQHWLQWIGGLEHAGLDEIPFFVALAGDNEMVLRLIANRWLTLDPQHFLRTLIAQKQNSDGSVSFSSFQMKNLTNDLFQRWVLSDPEAALAALSDPEVFAALAVSAPSIRHKALHVLFKQDPRRAFDFIKDWNMHHVTFPDGVFKKWIGQNPREAAETLLEFAPRYSSESHLKMLGRIWAESDPIAALDFALFKQSAHGEILAKTALAVWAQQDFTAASEWLAGLDDPATRSRLGLALVDIRLRKDPGEAVAWAQEHLRGQYLAVALRQVMGKVANSNPEAALALLEQIDTHSVYRQAASAMAVSWFKRMDRQGEIDAKAVAWLKTLDEDKPLNEAITKIGHHWAKNDPESYRDFLKNSRKYELSHSSYTAGIYDLMRVDPHGTLAWALELPERRIPEVSRSAFSTWYYSQPGAALDWYVQLPNDDVRRPQVVDGLVQYTTHLPVHVSAERLDRLPTGHKAELHQALSERSDLTAEKKAALLDILTQ